MPDPVPEHLAAISARRRSSPPTHVRLQRRRRTLLRRRPTRHPRCRLAHRRQRHRHATRQECGLSRRELWYQNSCDQARCTKLRIQAGPVREPRRQAKRLGRDTGTRTPTGAGRHSRLVEALKRPNTQVQAAVPCSIAASAVPSRPRNHPPRRRNASERCRTDRTRSRRHGRRRRRVRTRPIAPRPLRADRSSNRSAGTAAPPRRSPRSRAVVHHSARSGRSHTGTHHLLLIDRLEAIERGDIKRLSCSCHPDPRNLRMYLRCSRPGISHGIQIMPLSLRHIRWNWRTASGAVCAI